MGLLNSVTLEGCRFLLFSYNLRIFLPPTFFQPSFSIFFWSLAYHATYTKHHLMHTKHCTRQSRAPSSVARLRMRVHHSRVCPTFTHFAVSLCYVYILHYALHATIAMFGVRMLRAILLPLVRWRPHFCQTTNLRYALALSLSLALFIATKLALVLSVDLVPAGRMIIAW